MFGNPNGDLKEAARPKDFDSLKPTHVARCNRSPQIYNELREMFTSTELSEVIADLEKIHYDHLSESCDSSNKRLESAKEELVSFKRMIEMNG